LYVFSWSQVNSPPASLFWRGCASFVCVETSVLASPPPLWFLLDFYQPRILNSHIVLHLSFLARKPACFGNIILLRFFRIAPIIFPFSGFMKNEQPFQFPFGIPSLFPPSSPPLFQGRPSRCLAAVPFALRSNSSPSFSPRNPVRAPLSPTYIHCGPLKPAPFNSYRSLPPF